jgi:hypothetical protein
MVSSVGEMMSIDRTRYEEEQRVSAYVSPEAKAMLNEMAHEMFPNLKRPIGTALEQIIRKAYADWSRSRGGDEKARAKR